MNMKSLFAAIAVTSLFATTSAIACDDCSKLEIKLSENDAKIESQFTRKPDQEVKTAWYYGNICRNGFYYCVMPTYGPIGTTCYAYRCGGWMGLWSDW